VATIYIDDKPYEVREGQNLLQACLSLGFNLPYFCWHPAMHSVGACRQCAVKQFKDEKDTTGRIVMSCMTPAADGTRISIDDPEALKFRKSTIEWLMLNHPHDCPVCDEGGECHLQDMTVMTGHIYRRTRFKKRTYNNQYLGPFVNHEMNRCIQCYRCVRFYNDYAGGRDFSVFACHDHVYFGRHKDGVLENEFSGNLIEICPTGVFTDKTLKEHYTRKWDLQTAPSVCVHCGLGCNTIPGERYRTIRRIQNRYNGDVNGYFICDRGRFGYEFINSDQRIKKPFLSDMAKQKAGGENAGSVGKKMIFDYLSDLLYFGAGVIGVGSPRASLEANFALRTLVGPDRFYTGISEKDFRLISLIADILIKGPARSPSLHEIEMCDFILILGEDVTNTAPMLALSLRQSVRQKTMRLSDKLNIPRWHDHAVRDAVQHDKGPLFIAAPARTKLDDIATGLYHAAPDEIARLGFAVAHTLDNKSPVVTDLSPDVQGLAKEIARELMEAEKPLIISGTSCKSEAVIQSAANIAWALCRKGRPASLSFTVPECNSLGLGLMGGGSLNAAFKEVQDRKADTVVILENDLYRREDKQKVDKFFSEINHVIVMDCIKTPTTFRAEVLLPAGSYAETEGTIVNNEGRAQRSFKVMQPAEGIQGSWKWILDMTTVAERPEAKEWKLFEDITKALSESLPIFKPVADIAPPAGFRIAGMKIPRQSHRYSGRTAMSANISLHEPKPPDDPDSPLSFSMEGYEGIPPSSLITRFWSPGWNSVQSLNKFQSEVGGPLRGGDPGKRLIEPGKDIEASYFHEVPLPFKPRGGKLLIVPLYHIFGSEEFSILSSGIAELAPEPYLGLRADEMDEMQIQEGQEAEVTLNGLVLHLPVKCMSTLPPGTAGLPVGLPGLPWISLPQWAEFPGTKNAKVSY
jgi:NADH-quinone oxidoreductase subunit G